MLSPRTAHLDLAEAASHFEEHGFAPLGRVLTDEGAAALAARAEALMGARAPHPGVFYQHDSPSGRYEDLDFGKGWVGPSDRYRKLEKLEADPQFGRFIENGFFARLTRQLLGADVFLYRAVLWNKAPRVGMAVPWHQDDGRFWGLDRAPFLQVWTALDDAPIEAGCLQVLPGSHRAGLATPEGGTIPQRALDAEDAGRTSVALPARRGESFLVHNHTWHRTGRNRTPSPRRAVSISFLDGRTRCRRRRRAPRQFPQLFLDPAPS
ncbi:MAG: phytanoyl-CoA dioxygenase family protein [Deltaproteobacteria bacterium]|nr:phytanoyl-CoA dioxygenase family protein [Deltaproteobacteria bacterium]